MAAMSDAPVHCDLCRRDLPAHASYVVRIDVFADPSIPPTSAEALAAADFDQAYNELLEEMQGMTAEELQDGVHRRFEFRLCPACQRRFLANPLGKPRGVRAGKN